MSFHFTSSNIQIVDNHTLKATLEDKNGSPKQGSIDLNKFLGNSKGMFQWGGINFSETARNVRVAIEGDGQVPVLRADLKTVDGEFRWWAADINLSERIKNNNGNFEYTG